VSAHLLLVQAVAEEVAMTELRRADRNGGEHRPDRQGEEREVSVRGVGCAAAADGTAAGDRLALSGADLAACRQARALWSGLLDPEQAGGLSEAELGRAWTVAQCWRDVDPEAERAAELAEHELWDRRPDVMQRYDCLTAVGADHIEATLRVAPSLDRPAPATGHTIDRPGTGRCSSAETESTCQRVTVGRLLSQHLPEAITVHNLTAPPASSTVVAPTSLALNATSRPRRQG
jgi:hypothetical protein